MPSAWSADMGLYIGSHHAPMGDRFVVIFAPLAAIECDKSTWTCMNKAPTLTLTLTLTMTLTLTQEHLDLHEQGPNPNPNPNPNEGTWPCMSKASRGATRGHIRA